MRVSGNSTRENKTQLSVLVLPNKVLKKNSIQNSHRWYYPVTPNFSENVTHRNRLQTGGITTLVIVGGRNMTTTEVYARFWLLVSGKQISGAKRDSTTCVCMQRYHAHIFNIQIILRHTLSYTAGTIAVCRRLALPCNFL